MPLDENDFLIFYLFIASKSTRIKKARIKDWILTTVTFLCLAFLFYQSNTKPLGNYFLVVAVLCMTLYPFYSRWKYRRHYLKVAQEKSKHNLGIKSEFQFDNDTIGTKSETQEVKINKKDIEVINEIKGYYFFKAKSGITIMVSKTKTENINKIENEINSLVNAHGIKHQIELNWKWR